MWKSTDMARLKKKKKEKQCDHYVLNHQCFVNEEAKEI